MNRTTRTILLIVFLTLLTIGTLWVTGLAKEALSSDAIQISPPISTTTPLVLVYPDEVYQMTDAQFYRWAMKKNQKEREAWEAWRLTAEPQWITFGTVTEYRRERQGGFFQSNRETGYRRTYEPRYLNPEYRPRPLTIINPYCKPARD